MAGNSDFRESELNSVSCLLNNKFSRLSFAEKCNVKARGRPTPQLNIIQTSSSRNNTFERKFKADIYSKCDWLCGCEIKNAFFCFPCLLFGGEISWTQTGVVDLKHLNEKIKKHENSAQHIKNSIDFGMLGKINIATQVSEAYKLNIRKFNENVKKNRDILSKIIDCLIFCGKFELPLRGHNEKADSDNPGIFRGLLNFAGKLDENLKVHFENSTVFKANSKTIQNELLDCMLDICRTEISNEIEQAQFLAVMSDDTTDISEKTQEVIVFRYEFNGTIYERFWGFYNPESQDAEGLSKQILEQLKIVLKDNTGKLIAQTYDGAAVMSGARGGVQKIVKETYANAHFIHCYAHQLNLVMSKSVSTNREVRIFFSSLSGIPAFFSRSSQRLAELENCMSRRIPRGSDTRWNFNSRVVNTVFENIEQLKECFEKLQNSNNTQTVNEASGLLRLLNDNNFIFWLGVFHPIMPHVDLLYDAFQNRNINSSSAFSSLENFYRAISLIRETNFENLVSTNTDSMPVYRKRKCDENRNAAVKEVCDTICMQARVRFEFTGHLSAGKLLLQEKFETYCRQFPSQEFNETCQAYPMLNKNRLQTELSVLYERNSEFSLASGVAQLHQLFRNTGIYKTLGEVYVLMKILLTSPMTTAEAERCFSSLKRIKTYSRSTMLEDRVSALAMISIEKTLIDTIPNFHSKVTDRFAKMKNRRMDFIYK